VRRLALFIGLVVLWVLVTHRAAHAAASCQFSSASITFGNYDVYSTTALTGTGSITGVCTTGAGQNTAPVISLGKGANSTTFSPRQMACTSGACTTNGYSTDKLQYDLFTSAAMTSIWGDGTGTTSTVALAAGCCTNNLAWSATIYGRIPVATSGGANDVSVGGYSDSVTVTMNF
jgi:spore coat protein U-like protein